MTVIFQENDTVITFFQFKNIYYGFTAQVLKVYRTPGPTACLELLDKCI